jgi:hypothetical protein
MKTKRHIAVDIDGKISGFKYLCGLPWKESYVGYLFTPGNVKKHYSGDGPLWLYDGDICKTCFRVLESER